MDDCSFDVDLDIYWDNAQYFYIVLIQELSGVSFGLLKRFDFQVQYFKI